MTAPKRIQMRRTKGWRKPDGVVSCMRPGPYGNPFPIKGTWIMWTAVGIGYRGDAAGRRDAAVALHRAWLTGQPVEGGPLLGERLGGGAVEFSNGVVVPVQEHVGGIALWMAGMEAPPVLPAVPDLTSLRGRDLGCSCALDLPCHVDTLLDWANR